MNKLDIAEALMFELAHLYYRASKYHMDKLSYCIYASLEHGGFLPCTSQPHNKSYKLVAGTDIDFKCSLQGNFDRILPTLIDYFKN